VPFETVFERGEHYEKHCVRRGEFPCIDDVQYEVLADAFLTTGIRETIMQCTRPQGEIVRYDMITEEFGVLKTNGFVRTYFLAKPILHGYATNLCYFYAECWRIF